MHRSRLGAPFFFFFFFFALALACVPPAAFAIAAQRAQMVLSLTSPVTPWPRVITCLPGPHSD